MELFFAALPARSRGSRAGRLSCCVSVGVNAREVVLPEELRSRCVERVLVERTRPPERTIGAEWRSLAPVEDDVPVRAGDGGEARVEARRRLPAATTATSAGSSVFSALASRSGGGPPSASRLATCPVACTPASVRPATARPSQRGSTASRASRRAPSTVRSPGCRAHPLNPAPSYSSVSRSVATADCVTHLRGRLDVEHEARRPS